MTQLLVTIQDETKSRFISKLLKEFEYVKVRRQSSSPKRSLEDTRILKNIESAVEELNLAKTGKIKLQDAFEMLVELKEELKNEGYHAD